MNTGGDPTIDEADSCVAVATDLVADHAAGHVTGLSTTHDDEVDSQALEHQLAGCAIRTPSHLFPSQLFGVELVDGDGDARTLDPRERELIRRAVPKRRAEFAAGRTCAHRALDRLGPEGREPLLRDAHGSPLWPTGTVGSISHAGGRAVSVVARRGNVEAVGVDIERWTEPFPDGALGHVCTDGERARLPADTPATRLLRRLHVHACFSIKEAIYKCVYAGTGLRLGFADADVVFDLQQGLFHANLRQVLPSGRITLTGRVGCDARHVFAGVWWLAPAVDATSTAGAGAVSPVRDQESWHATR